MPIAEASVQHALRSFVRPGATVFDVGAAQGWVTESLATLVQPGGRVIAFEATGRNLYQLNAMLTARRLASVVTVIDKAVWREDGARLTFYENPFANTDSLYFKADAATPVEVESVSLDATAARLGAWPDVIKIDIEGAEADAFLGGPAVLDRAPVIAMEVRKEDPRPIEMLAARGYRFINLRSLARYPSAADVEIEAAVEDLLCLPASASPHGAWGKDDPVVNRLSPGIRTQAGVLALTEVELEAGVNVVEISFSDPPPTYDQLVIEAMQDGRCVAMIHGQTYLVGKPCVALMFVAMRPARASIAITNMTQPAMSADVAVTRRLSPFTAEEAAFSAEVQRRLPFGIGIDVLAPYLEEALTEGQLMRFDVVAEQLKRHEMLRPALLRLMMRRGLRS